MDLLPDVAREVSIIARITLVSCAVKQVAAPEHTKLVAQVAEIICVW